MDCAVVSWIFNTISSELLDDIHQPDGTSARAAWLALEQQFLNNRASRAMLLDAEFRALSQGALSIDEYCRKMKGIADALADLGEPIPDHTFVLNLLRGLNERFQFMSQLVTRQRPLPPFAEVRADLRLAELNMPAASSPASALVTTTPGKPSTPSLPTGSPSRPPQAVGGGPLAIPAADAVVAAAAMEARLVVRLGGRRGPLSSIRGQDPSTCGPAPPLAAHAVFHLAPARLIHRRC
jgi:hypothetical protein